REDGGVQPYAQTSSSVGGKPGGEGVGRGGALFRFQRPPVRLRDLAAGLPPNRGGGLGVGLNASILASLGQGTFMSGAAQNPSLVTQISLQPTLQIDQWTLFASQALAVEATDPDNPAGQRVTWFDTSLGALYPVRLASLSTSLQFSGGLRLPTSQQSQAQGSLGGAFLGVTSITSTPLEGLRVIVGLRGQANTAFEELRGIEDGDSFQDASLGVTLASTCLLRTGESAADACGPIPNVANLSGALRLTYGRGPFFAVVGVSVISLVSAFSGPDDELRAEGARPGLNATTFTSGTVSGNYQLRPWLVVGLGTQSFQPIQTADGQGLRFPFWNFTGAANNFSSFFVSSTFIL
ncbi:MAG: hypothetical protein AAFZ18_38865, partial [Myxococcota bacterium]